MKTVSVKKFSDSQLIKKNRLFNNPKSQVDDFVNKAKLVQQMVKDKDPEIYKDMCEWRNNFQDIYELTCLINPVSKLHYLIQYSEERKKDGMDMVEMMGEMMFAPQDFLELFAKHFVAIVVKR